MKQKHLIEKQVLHVATNATKDAYVVQQKISDWVQSALNPAIEELFDSLVDAHVIARFDRIAIDIGTINLDNSTMEQCTEKIIQQLRETIEDKLHHIGAQNNRKQQEIRESNQEFFDRNKRSFQNNLLANENNLDPKENKEHKEEHSSDNSTSNGSSKEYQAYQSGTSRNQKESSQPQRKHYFDIWLYWLEKGILPAYTSAPQETWITQILAHLGVTLDGVTILAHTLKKHPIALHRLVLQHAAKDLKSIVELYTGFSQEQLLQMLQEITVVSQKAAIVIPKIPLRSVEIKIWKKIFEQVIIKGAQLNSIAIGKYVLKYLIANNIINATKLHQIVFEDVTVQKGKKEFPILFEVLEKEATETKDSESVSPSSVQSEDSNPESEEETLISKNSKNTIADEEAELQKKKAATADKGRLEKEIKNQEGNAIENNPAIEDQETFEAVALPSPQYFDAAGVVLLNPFLNNFFTRLGLIADKDFKDFASRSKAVVLLHFLATGKENSMEYEMVLAKFLCEMPSNRSLDHTIKITKEEKEEAVGLLKVVIEHWGALGKISADGLREGFLIRQGKLENEGTGWKLYIEQKAMDILLDRLPWNISIVKLPWMKELLTVEWR